MTAALSLVDAWLARLEGPAPAHPRFVGTPLSIEGLTPTDLGQLWPAMRRAAATEDADAPAHQAAGALRSACAEAGLEPVFGADTGLQVLQIIETGRWADAVQLLGGLTVPSTPEMGQELLRVLGPEDAWHQGLAQDAYQAVAIARRVGEVCLSSVCARLRARFADAPLRCAELDVLPHIGHAALLHLAGTRNSYYWADEAGQADAAAVLAEDPRYAAFARQALEGALRTLQAIHAGHIPYRADAAFVLDDAHLLARCARVAAWRDDDWYRALIGDLLVLVCVAPTEAKTLPSQSLAVALGHSVEGVPTPESVQALRAALAVTRHAGIQKKLGRNLKPAERALATRPEVALRMTGISAKPDKKLQAMVATCLEAGWWQGLRWSAAQWLTQIAEPVNGRPFATGQVWVAALPDAPQQNFILQTDGRAHRGVDVHGRELAWNPAWTLRLWHPMDGDADTRTAWREYFAARRLRQPVRQAWREIYRPRAEEADLSASSEFSGHVLSIRPLLGLARREGWRIAHGEGLVRRFGAVRVSLLFGTSLYPGQEGYSGIDGLCLAQTTGVGLRPLAIGTVEPVVLSEIFRAVDLLVSVSAFAAEDAAHAPGDPQRTQRIDHLATLPLSVTARLRRDALTVVLASAVAQGRVSFDAHHLRIGACAVHLGTARVSCNGEAVELPASTRTLAAVPWLPYDEVLLQRIADAAGMLLGQ